MHQQPILIKHKRVSVIQAFKDALFLSYETTAKIDDELNKSSKDLACSDSYSNSLEKLDSFSKPIENRAGLDNVWKTFFSSKQ